MFLVFVLLGATLAEANCPAPQAEVKRIGVDYVLFEVASIARFDQSPVVAIGAIIKKMDNWSNNTSSMVVKHHQLVPGGGGGRFEKTINITNLVGGNTYQIQFYAINSKQEKSEASEPQQVLLLPRTPDFAIARYSGNTIRMTWSVADFEHVDNFTLSIETASAQGCGYTITFAKCFGNTYDFANAMLGENYNFVFVANNPTGPSEPVRVTFPFQ